ncbi:hypothetical protein GCM10027578_03240 [Spirosoma luteolum]
MELIPLLLTELASEAATTHTMLSRIPADQFDWRPHPKSMTMLNLATHIAELPGWVAMAFTLDGVDFATTPYTPTPIRSVDELLALQERSRADAQAQLEQADEASLADPWTLRNGDVLLQQYTRYSAVRMAFSQISHHRAQLGVYLRLLDIPIPGSYGPSADEQAF